MKKFMIITEVDGTTTVQFADSYNDVKNIAIDVECGCGGSYEIYERQINDADFPEYVFLEA